MRIAIIGAGHVGATAAYALMLRALVSEIILVDVNADLARAEATDIADANMLARPAHIMAGDYGDAASAEIAVITAGAATHGDESRLSVASRSATIVGECVDRLIEAGFAGIILVAANPVDLMALVAYRHAGMPAPRVIGTGTLLDSSRLRHALATRLDVAAGAIEGFVLGEHGDSEVAAFSTVRVGGLTLDRFPHQHAALDFSAIAAEVRDSAYRIVAGKGYTSFAIATAIVRICEAISRDERSILPVSTWLSGQFGYEGFYMSLPCIVGAGGIEEVLTPDLGQHEIAAVRASAEALRAAIARMDTD